MAAWADADAAYAAMQRTKPQTLAFSLDDSPAGLAAWILEKFQAWSDCGGDVWSRFTRDELLDNITLYWVTQTGGSSVRYYRDAALSAFDPAARVAVPTGFTIFPRDIPPAPRAFAERYFDVVHWERMPSGGHFGAWEEPARFAGELRTFFGSLA
jgi:pimeloyl-ACP methyl ester carboxylesterase